MDEVSTPLPGPLTTKADWRERQRNLSFAEKIAILEKMRERDALIATAGLRGKSPSQANSQPSPQPPPDAST